ncbi:hypothetical protein LTR37_006491 [Vermiconidia calcicola]|uniref:Uncharacterized protein n=1 Tax=Vermiconidia calcicola TaxID=1690605 RepID=A0ACC3NFZ2_9PEZI|nr:hypothetical protein LTR37_006491 [Vermiconidia calcicola]
MRLIDTATLQLRNNLDSKQHSHTWGEHELSLQDFEQAHKRTGPGFEKIEQCCRLAGEAGIEFAWVDTCCIDKTNSVELTEAVQSMFTWYEDAAVCYAFLDDLAGDQNTRTVVTGAELKQCRWFTRGWTLQELLAPWHIFFYNQAFKRVGTKVELNKAISDVTGVPINCLSNTWKPEECCIAQRMSWISERQTSRPEDMAYCLLGVFDINMPLDYGEGRRKAFLRLQEQIIARSDDESIFAWTCLNSDDNRERRGILAEDPTEFKYGGRIRLLDGPTRPPYSFSNRGLEISVQRGILPWRRWEANVALNCSIMVPVNNRQTDRSNPPSLATGTYTSFDQDFWEAAAYEQRRVVIRLKRFEKVRQDIISQAVTLTHHRVWYRTDLRTFEYYRSFARILGNGVLYRNVCVARTHLEYEHDAMVVSTFPSTRGNLRSFIFDFLPLLALIIMIFSGYYAVEGFTEPDLSNPTMALSMMATVWAYLTTVWTYFQGGAWSALRFPMLVGAVGASPRMGLGARRAV